MSADPSSRNSFKDRKPLLLLTVAVVLGALGVAAVAGAFAYRTFLTDKPGDNIPQKLGSPVEAKGGPEPDHNGSPGGRFRAQFNTDSMYPAFRPSRDFYVTRCLPGKVEVEVNATEGSTVRVGPYPPVTGRFTAEARPLPGQDFDIVIDTGGNERTYRMRCLPDDFPDWDYSRFEKPPRGTFFVSFRPEPNDSTRNWAVVFDQEGTPRWWFSPPTNTLGGQILPDGTFQIPRGFGDGFGQDPRTGNEVRSLDGKLLRVVKARNAPTDAHEYTRLPNGNVLINSYRPIPGVDLTPVGGPADAGVLAGEIQEVTPSGRVVWKWNSLDHVPLDYTPERWWKKILNNPHTDINGDDHYDIFHFNSAEPWGEDQMVISSRHTDKVLGISRKTGAILWTFGGEPDSRSLKIKGDDPLAEYPIGGNHDARISDRNLLSVHDNGTNLGRPPRAVEYRIDLKHRTATFEGQLTDPTVKRSHCCGGVRPFGSGWLVAWGNNPVVDGFNSEDELAFRLKLPVPVYRAVPVPSQVSVNELDRALERMETGPPMSRAPVNPVRIHGG
ncbi:MAG: arylsulfotransferase family protein [Solirubrobacterales bacterium]